MALIEAKELPPRRLFPRVRERVVHWLGGEHSLSQRMAGTA